MSGRVAPSGPMLGFLEAERAWKVKVAEWLGLDISEVLDVEWQRHPAYDLVVWASTSTAKPTRGNFDRWDARGDHEQTVVTGRVYLDAVEAKKLLGYAGERPTLKGWMADVERAELRERFLTVLSQHELADMPGGGTASYAFHRCSCGEDSRIPGGLREAATQKARGHLADMLVAEVDR